MWCAGSGSGIVWGKLLPEFGISTETILTYLRYVVNYLNAALKTNRIECI